MDLMVEKRRGLMTQHGFLLCQIFPTLWIWWASFLQAYLEISACFSRMWSMSHCLMVLAWYLHYETVWHSEMGNLGRLGYVLPQRRFGH
jgi:hypothetical protein